MAPSPKSDSNSHFTNSGKNETGFSATSRDKIQVMNAKKKKTKRQWRKHCSSQPAMEQVIEVGEWKRLTLLNEKGLFSHLRI